MYHMKNDGCRNKCFSYHRICMEVCTSNFKSCMGFGAPVQAILAIGSIQHIVVGCVIASVYIFGKVKGTIFASYFT